MAVDREEGDFASLTAATFAFSSLRDARQDFFGCLGVRLSVRTSMAPLSAIGSAPRGDKASDVAAGQIWTERNTSSARVLRFLRKRLVFIWLPRLPEPFGWRK